MNKAILEGEVQHYLQANADADASALALKKSPFDRVSSSELANQIDGMQRVQKKMPAWSAKPNLYYPDKLNLEQCSSQETGLFKAGLIPAESKLVDLTGGFGVDSYYFAQCASHVWHCELNANLSAIVAHNFAQLGVSNVSFITGDGIAALAALEANLDVVYIDPSRRVKQQKVFHLADCEPNILAHQDLFFAKANVIITKLAPLLDIHLALKDLKYVKAVYVISVANDCKELIFLQEKGFTGEPLIHAVRLTQGRKQQFSFTLAEEKAATPTYTTPSRYLYDPDVAITKAGAFKSMAIALQLSKLHVSSHLYTSEQLLPDFPGRVFAIEQVIALKQFKKQKENIKANVIAKNFPLKVEEIRKKYKIKDGGETFLFFTTQSDGDLVVIKALRY